MKHRKIGGSGLSCAPLVLGCHVFGWTVDEAGSSAILDAFIDRGFAMIDTADTYSTWAPGHQGGESERIIGNWLNATGKRDQVLIATKVGGDMKNAGRGLSKAHVIRSAEHSLRRLKTDRIDLYQAHFDDTTVSFEETLEAFSSLIQSGKVRAIGASNYSAPRLAEALRVARLHGLPLYTCLQPHYNLITRSFFEGGLRQLCVAEDLGVIPFRGLEAGFLTGKYRSIADTVGAARGASVAQILDPRSLDILSELDAAALRFDATPAQVAIAWLLGQPGVAAPVVSVTTLDQLNEISGALALTLDARTLMRLDLVSA
ncbi:aldo/keto reductase [Methylocapsa palsarum]|uniref:Predicted oxidoreductase n=1 Tax=Methylocapsa palsarum TaxID=1612308 RepID=A0A1I4AQ11_9HYPH|nr:aldo/keto reductase [Methylocapsa palsarum]SFK58575.1 Predicted oxidoreductase [Methylocapsa palsarum]